MEKVKEENVRVKRNFNLLLFVTFLSGVIIVFALMSVLSRLFNKWVK